MSIEGTAHLRSIVNRWDADHEEDSDPLADLAVLLFQLDLLLGDVKAYRSRIEQEFARRSDTKLLVADGITAEVKGGAKRKNWDWPLLADAVVEVAMEQGESPKDALIDCIGVTPSHNWRVGALRKRGLDPDQYAEVSYGMPSVIVRAKEEGE